MRKRRIGTAKFFTLLLLLYHTSAKVARLKQQNEFLLDKCLLALADYDIYHYKISHYSAYSNSPAKYKAEMQTLENQINQNL